mmetsp:Transcript_14345/g.23845  ORF Transcript_14345/g.23845 Transcript_14345/m.23845 type:complete len:161 (+) Transcript_14345:2-484(+)
MNIQDSNEDYYFHYVNVPNLNTSDWQHMYYGTGSTASTEDVGNGSLPTAPHPASSPRRFNYKYLQAVKLRWDPENQFTHPQSVELPFIQKQHQQEQQEQEQRQSAKCNHGLRKQDIQRHCSRAYHRHANKYARWFASIGLVFVTSIAAVKYFFNSNLFLH